MLMKAASQSLTEQLSARFAERIRSRLLAPGARLPSVRLCAEQQGVSPSTVVAAYDQLLAQGLVVARKNRGFFVREPRSTRLAPTLIKRGHGAGKAGRRGAVPRPAWRRWAPGAPPAGWPRARRRSTPRR
jgi:DNA-binding GntR family transcriptional regulator